MGLHCFLKPLCLNTWIFRLFMDREGKVIDIDIAHPCLTGELSDVIKMPRIYAAMLAISLG